ncbi:MAG: hypothetical protein SGJ18_05600 [Pseudomonadota bacterium]|nr:hypothetical protein [Pseudomonadota bacterium]
MVEFLSTLTVLCLVIPSFLAVIYLGVARVSIKFIIKQAGVCLSFERSVGTCRTNSIKLARRLLPLGSITSLNLTRSKKMALVKISFSMANKIHLAESYVVDLPLKADAL